MSHRPIMDAGPGINFLSLHQERLLFGALGALCVPEVVREEIVRKASQEQRFAAAADVLAKLPDRLLHVLPDDVSDDLSAAVLSICGMALEQRTRISKDLGEIMVIAHAVVAAETGDDITVLIDDRGGRDIAARQAQRLNRMREQGRTVGRLSILGTPTVLERAAGGPYLPDRSAMRSLYNRLRALDDGLPPLGSTNLMSLTCWP